MLNEEELNKIKEQYPEFKGQWRKNTKNLTGNRYDKVVCLYRGENRKERTSWVCLCDCGNICLKYTYNLEGNNGRNHSCNHCGDPDGSQGLYNFRYTRPNWKDLTGNKYGKLTVIKKTEHFVADNRIGWLVKCECGREFEVDSHSLQQGRVDRCGYC